MKLIRCASGLVVCGSLLACGGTKPAVEPAPVTKNDPAAPAVSAAAAPSAAPANINLEDPVQRYSYALGVEMGKTLDDVNVPLDYSAVMEAVKDYVDSARTVRMDDAARESAMEDLLLKMQVKQESDRKAAAQKALDEQAQFLSRNVMDSTVKVTPKGVQYKVIKEGSGLVPKISDNVRIHYVGSLLDGTEFDNSIKRNEPMEYPVAVFMEGFQDLLQVMKEGGKVKAWIPSALAYGEDGVDPLIPPNSLLVFEVELIKVLAEVPAAEPAVAPVEEPAAPAAEPATSK
ncbi:MAG: FKBP-type peptidyl-prolyl cis-trans isomerase [Fibrobacter sp.]|nr:FKBP-type peptidyl-prolyl cis-trans isomerase [Fibrobacter sp.]